MKIRIILLSLILSVCTSSHANAIAPQIMGPDMKVIDNNIIVNLNVDSVNELAAPITSGVEKEITFTIELLRAWTFWPDEFIVSKKISKIVKYDTLRERYRALLYDGVRRQEKSFYTYDAVKEWLFTVNNVNLANVKELESSTYYIRIVVESKSLEQLPLIGFLIHFMPEVEMSLAKESAPFIIGDN